MMKPYKTFENFTNCITYLKDKYNKHETVLIENLNIDNSKEIIEIPRFFFRGESKYYETTYSSLVRIRHNNKLPKKMRLEIEKVVDYVSKKLEEWLKINETDALGFLQHYGLPTEFLDISPNLATAIFFASYLDSTIKHQENDTEKGFICVFDFKNISKNISIVDLRRHPIALRPKLQDAYVFRHIEFSNIKDLQCIEKLDLKWYCFKSTKKEKETYHNDNNILPSYSADKTSAFLYQTMIEIPFKVNDWSASYIANECDIPLIPILIDKNKSELVSLNDTEIKYHKNVARLNLYRQLSNQYVDTKNSGGLNPFD